jgi:hypothetical protein
MNTFIVTPNPSLPCYTSRHKNNSFPSKMFHVSLFFKCQVSCWQHVSIPNYARNVLKIVRMRTGPDWPVSGNGNKRRKTRKFYSGNRRNLDLLLGVLKTTERSIRCCQLSSPPPQFCCLHSYFGFTPYGIRLQLPFTF